MKTGITLLATALLLIATAPAATYHVDVLTGSDSRAGTTPATSWKTLAQACERVAAGDSVIVHPGVYHESAVLHKAGTADRPIRFRADEVARGRVIITGADRDLRARRNVWAGEPGHRGVYSTTFGHRPVRVLADDIDLFPYTTLVELDALELKGAVPGPAQGFAYDAKARKLYVRLNRKYGSLSPAAHVMKAAPAGGGETATRRMDEPFDANFAVRVAGPAHVILEGFTFETPGLCGVFAEGGQVTVRNCWFLGCRTGVAGRSAADGKSTDDVTIERCEFTQEPAFADVEDIAARAKARPAKKDAPKLPAYFWSVRGGASTYEYGLALNVGARWKILRNYLHDSVDGLSHWSLGAARDVEIAFNTFERLVDNAIETGDHCGTLRAHHNYLADVFEPFSWDPKGGTPWPGPLTFDHNVVTSTVRGGKLWLALGVRPGCFELNCADANWSKPQMKDVPTTPVKIPGTGLTAYNNTIILPLADFFTFTGLTFRRIEGVRVLNNLIVVREFTPARYHDAADLSGMEFDGNFVAPASGDAPRADRRLAGPKGRLVDDAAKLGLTNPTHAVFGLRAKSPALGGGVTARDLPGLSPDIGAHAQGSDGRHPLAGPVPATPAPAPAAPPAPAQP